MNYKEALRLDRLPLQVSKKRSDTSEFLVLGNIQEILGINGGIE